MKYKVWWLIAAGVLLTGIGLALAGAALAAGAPAVPAGYDLITAVAGAPDAVGPAPDDFTAMQAAVQGSKFSWWAKAHGTIGTADRNTAADIYAVSGSFQDFHHMDMLYGSFLPRVDNGSNAVVLESDLAYRIFGTFNAVGLEVEYDGATYQVCGVSRSDGSLLGLMSGNGQFRAYLTGRDLVATGKLNVGGFEAYVPSGAPGEGLANVKTAMQNQGLSAGAYLIEDKSEQLRLDAEAAALPMVALSVSAAAVLLAFLLRVARGILRDSMALLRGDYLRNTWGALLWQAAKLTLLAGASVGLFWLMWTNTGLDFYLPAKYIPGSWIDPTFYKSLIQSESQAAIAAAAYPRQWWDVALTAAAGLSRALNLLALVGALATALSMRALWADRRAAAAAGKAKAAMGAWDVPALWGLAILSVVAAVLLSMAAGLPAYPAMNAPVVLALALMVWSVAMHRRKLEGYLFDTRNELKTEVDIQ